MDTQDLVRGCMSRRAGRQADGVRQCWWVGERLHKHRLTPNRARRPLLQPCVLSQAVHLDAWAARGLPQAYSGGVFDLLVRAAQLCGVERGCE